MCITQCHAHMYLAARATPPSSHSCTTLSCDSHQTSHGQWTGSVSNRTTRTTLSTVTTMCTRNVAIQ